MEIELKSPLSYLYTSVWKGLNQWGWYANKSANKGKAGNTSPFPDNLHHSPTLTALLSSVLKTPEMCLIVACLLCILALIVDTDQCLQTFSSPNDEICAAKHVVGFLI